MNINLIYASLTGNTEALSDLMIEKFDEVGIHIEKHFIEDLEDFSVVEESDALIVATYTYGDGELPEEMEEFFESLGDMDLSGKKFAVIGTGDTVYEEFCYSVDDFDEKLEKAGAERIADKLKIEIEADCDEDFENIDKFISDFKNNL